MSAPAVFVVEITAAIDAAGTLQTWYFSSGTGFATRPSDTPANTPIAPRLANPGNYRRELFSGNATFGAVRPAFGEMVISNADGALDAWRGYGFDGRALTIRYGTEGAAYPSAWTTVLKCTMVGIDMDLREIRVKLRDRLHYLDAAVLGDTFAGGGALEGPADMAGQAKPRHFGDTAYIPAVLVDAAKLIYWIHDEATTLSSLPTVLDGGVALTREANYADLATLQSTAPSAGAYRCYRDGPTYIRLGSPPAYDLQVNTSTTATTFAAAAVEAGVSDASGGSGQIYNSYVTDPATTWLDLLRTHAVWSRTFFGFTRLDAWQAAVFAAPSGSAAHTFTLRNCERITRSAPPDLPVPAWRVAGKSWRVWAAGATLAPTASAAVRATLATDYSKSDAAEDAAVLTKHPLAPTLALETDGNLTGQTAGYLALFGTARDLFTVRCVFSAALLALDLNDVVALQMPRFGLAAGKLFRIVAVRLDLAAHRIEFALWG